VCKVHNCEKCVLGIMGTSVYVKITRRNVLQIISRFSGQFNLVMSQWIIQPGVITDNKTAASAPQADPPINRCGTLTDNQALVLNTHLQQYTSGVCRYTERLATNSLINWNLYMYNNARSVFNQFFVKYTIISNVTRYCHLYFSDSCKGILYHVLL